MLCEWFLNLLNLIEHDQPKTEFFMMSSEYPVELLDKIIKECIENNPGIDCSTEFLKHLIIKFFYEAFNANKDTILSLINKEDILGNIYRLDILFNEFKTNKCKFTGMLGLYTLGI